MIDALNPRRFKQQLLAATVATVSGFSSSAFTAERLLEEIIVTAQKRAESVQDVPIAISAFSSDAITNLGAQNVNDLGKFTPGLETNVNNETQASYTIRGISSSSFGAGDESSVGVYVDGIYVARSGGALVNFADVERVEVLKGPQGTLFGRNAAAGAINIITKKPVEITESMVKASIGSYDRRNFDVIHNTALSNNLYMRAGASIQRNDGIYDNDTGPNLEQDDSQTYTLKFLYDGFDNTEVLWMMDYNKLSQRNSSDMTTNPTLNPAAKADDPQLGAYENRRTDVTPEENRELFGTALVVTHDINEELSLKSTTSYREFRTNNFEDEDGWDNPWFYAGSDNIEEQEQYSQEFIFTYQGDKLKWSAGGNWFKESISQDHVIQFNRQTIEQFATGTILKDPAFAPALAAVGLSADDLTDSSGYDLINDSAHPLLQAAWGLGVGGALGLPLGTQVPYSLGDGLGVFLIGNAGSLGLDPASVAGLIGPQLGSGNLGPILGVDSSLWEEVTSNRGENESWAIFGDFTYSITDKLDLTAGARFSYDEKAFAVSTTPQNQIAGADVGLAFSQPGSVKNSEEWESLTSRVAVNYHVNNDVMLFATWSQGFKPGGFNSFITDQNGDGIADELEPFDEEEISNIEVGIKSTWFDGNLRFNASLYDFTYDNKQELSLTDEIYVGQVLPLYATRTSDLEGDGYELELQWLATDNLLIAANMSHTQTEYTRYGLFAGEDADDDKTGKPSTSVPENKYNVFVEYRQPIGDAGSLTTNINYNWTDERTGTNEDAKIDSYDLINARLTYEPNNGDWTIAAWSNNLTDEEYVYNIGGTGGAIGSEPVSRAPGRTYGLDFTYNF